jgi:hypothetical protein
MSHEVVYVLIMMETMRRLMLLGIETSWWWARRLRDTSFRIICSVYFLDTASIQCGHSACKLKRFVPAGGWIHNEM